MGYPAVAAGTTARTRGFDSENVARLRPQYRRPDPADRLSWARGDAAQCDLWFPPARIPLADAVPLTSRLRAAEHNTGDDQLLVSC
jgi:hypothetical protein